MRVVPCGVDASWSGGWHGWGNSQTMGLAQATQHGLALPGALASAEAEANTLYAHLLVEGLVHEMTYATGASRQFEQIAYDVRPMAVGLVRLYEATTNPRYAVMAGLAASWFRGNNPAGAVMADPATGRGYDGILDSTRVNPNSGAESTIEAQMTLLEVNQHPEAVRWMVSRAEPPRTVTVDGQSLRIREFVAAGPRPDRAVVVLNVAQNTSDVLTGPEAVRFLSTARP